MVEKEIRSFNLYLMRSHICGFLLDYIKENFKLLVAVESTKTFLDIWNCKLKIMNWNENMFYQFENSNSIY